jgi:hypothetical protein
MHLLYIAETWAIAAIQEDKIKWAVFNDVVQVVQVFFILKYLIGQEPIGYLGMVGIFKFGNEFNSFVRL